MDSQPLPPPVTSTRGRFIPRVGHQSTRWLLALAYGLVLWAVVVGLVMLVGRWILPGTNSGSLVLALAAIELATAVVVAIVTVDYLRRSGATSVADGLRFGVVGSIAGTTLDGLLLLATDFDLPGISEDKTLTFAAALFFGYAVFLLVSWLVAAFRFRGQPD